MEQPIINSNVRDEQLIYPTNNDISLIDNNAIPPNDKYYIDLCMNSEDKKVVLETQIVRTDYDTFSLLRDANIVTGIMIAILCFGTSIPILMNFQLEKDGLYSYITVGIVDFIGFLIALYFILFAYDDIYLTLDPYSIKITKKARIRTKIINYNVDELEKAGLYYKYMPDSDGSSHYYFLYLVHKSGKKEKIKKICSKNKDIEFEGLKYFVDLLNNHIMKNRF